MSRETAPCRGGFNNGDMRLYLRAMVEIGTDVPVAARSGDEWRALRKELGLTLNDLSSLTGLNRGTIQQLEHGGRVNESTRRLVAVTLREPDLVKAAAA